MGFPIKWNISVVNEWLGHISVMRSEFSKTDDSLLSDFAAKSFSKFRCKEKKKEIHENFNLALFWKSGALQSPSGRIMPLLCFNIF